MKWIFYTGLVLIAGAVAIMYAPIVQSYQPDAKYWISMQFSPDLRLCEKNIGFMEKDKLLVKLASEQK